MMLRDKGKLPSALMTICCRISWVSVNACCHSLKHTSSSEMSTVGVSSAFSCHKHKFAQRQRQQPSNR